MPEAPPDARARVVGWLKSFQDRLCGAVEALEGQPFREDLWERPGGGGGRSRMLEDGQLLERGGVGFSEVWGDQLPPSVIAQRPEAAGHSYVATGVSLVWHPRNPFAPTVHLNYRYFQAGDVWWFGGGADLTPSYLFEEDARHFHKAFRDALAPHHPRAHDVFKRWCDEYFYIKHRSETRGVGGIFFDYQDGERPFYAGQNPELLQLTSSVGSPNMSWEQVFAMWQSCGDAFLGAYLPILETRSGLEYTQAERDWQLYRRGRYVEFNLVWDRGTLFGLQTGGRVESILMSMPPLARWQYDYHPEPGSKEAELLTVLREPRDWV
jgi:coproporphyrinogen III oxidase